MSNLGNEENLPKQHGSLPSKGNWLLPRRKTARLSSDGYKPTPPPKSALESIHGSVYTFGMKTKVFKSGNSLAVRLPKGMEMACGPVSIRREGQRIVIEEEGGGGWPEGFFEDIRIARKDFGREVPEYREKRL